MTMKVPSSWQRPSSGSGALDCTSSFAFSSPMEVKRTEGRRSVPRRVFGFACSYGSGLVAGEIAAGIDRCATIRLVVIYCSNACIRALLLATSAGQRARLMLPTGLLSGVEFPVTSEYVALLSSGESCDFGRRV